ncbi:MULTISPECIES: thiamine pyrophosphate-binding protein [Streptomyces]|uniref:thiamine pyrophosphate-binding protein n=1 Tax=Streptomyces TaxID=1883 RepID=UPI001672CBB9|nr:MULTISPECIES: thiamine pyrophosphate-binding protein [Streptomyces]MBK3527829.1 thiamine pyrophosphate-binding protein [Streptomyces sp. MBT70]GGR95363.1 benzoylformate decarboxylase [Streptomyces eurythermus]
MPSRRPARVAMLEQFRADGVEFMFGNPGTVEQGFLDELRGFPDIEYILTLQESVAVGIADGYARATQQPALIQLHTGVGLGNAVGLLYQAMRGHAPLVVVAGEAGLRYEGLEAQMAADLVGMARPVTKWATRVVDPDSTLRTLRRAFKVAATEPRGPVLVVLPADVMDRTTDEPVVPTSYLDTSSAPSDSTLAQAASLLVGARKPLIIAGDGVHTAHAQEELGTFARLWGAEVWGADWAEVNLPVDHPCYAGQLGHMFGENSARVTSQADAVLIVGTYVLPEVYPALSGVFATGAKVVHIDLDTGAIAKNFPVDLGVVAHPKPALAGLARVLEGLMGPADTEQAAARVRELAGRKEEQLARETEQDRLRSDAVPMPASVFARELACRLPEGAILFDEALTSSPDIFRYLRPNLPGHWFQTRGGSLGVGIPGAIGAKLAHPGREVIGFTGDGGSMYTIQALWTAARHQIGAKFVICNNGSYELLKDNIAQYWNEQGIEAHAFPDLFDLKPEIGFVELSQSLGVPAMRVEKADQVPAAVEAMLAQPGPFLVDLVTARAT